MFSEVTVKKAIKGDEEAFMLLIDKIKEQLYRTAYAYVKDENLALDIVQDTVCKAFISIDKLREPKFFKTWIMKIAINICKNTCKKNSRVVYMEKEHIETMINEEVEDQYDNGYLLEAIETLKPKHKQVIILKYFNDLTVVEIARVLDIPIGTVKTYLNKGLSSLRRQIGIEEVI